MRAVPLTVVKGGISRLREKGAARPDLLYDLLNGYVTAAKTIAPRPGTARVATVPGTKGLTAFDGRFHVFASSIVAVPHDFVLHVITHPDDGDGNVIALERIHFAEPFLGFLYVVAEFANGDVLHFWLQSGGTWEAGKVYSAGDLVEPSVPNGLAYEATRVGSPGLAWAPRAPRQVGDVVEPTTFNNYRYRVVAVSGAHPASGSTEPDWPTSPGARVTEDTEANAEGVPVTTSDPETQAPSSGVEDRYGS
jgi:hypothetical protein